MTPTPGGGTSGGRRFSFEAVKSAGVGGKRRAEEEAVASPGRKDGRGRGRRGKSCLERERRRYGKAGDRQEKRLRPSRAPGSCALASAPQLLLPPPAPHRSRFPVHGSPSPSQRHEDPFRRGSAFPPARAPSRLPLGQTARLPRVGFFPPVDFLALPWRKREASFRLRRGVTVAGSPTGFLERRLVSLVASSQLPPRRKPLPEARVATGSQTPALPWSSPETPEPAAFTQRRTLVRSPDFLLRESPLLRGTCQGNMGGSRPLPSSWQRDLGISPGAREPCLGGHPCRPTGPSRHRAKGPSSPC